MLRRSIQFSLNFAPACPLVMNSRCRLILQNTPPPSPCAAAPPTAGSPIRRPAADQVVEPRPEAAFLASVPQATTTLRHRTCTRTAPPAVPRHHLREEAHEAAASSTAGRHQELDHNDD